MSWDCVKLGEVCIKIGSGATPKGGSTVYVNSGTSFIRSQNVYNLQFDYSGLVCINEDAAKKLNGVTIQKEDVLLNITGDSVARTCVVPEEVLPARVNQHVAIVRPDRDVLNPYFLNYYLASPYMQSFMLGLAVGKGASRNAMTKDMIYGFEVPCPPIDVQKEIVYILKTYDDLIENNKKQIKLLEEVAQRLYKEWFVDLRFPGCEDCKIEDGVPEGWERSVVGKYLRVRSGYAFKSGWWQDTGYPVVKIKDIVNNIVDISTVDYVAPEHTFKIPEFKLDKGDIVIAMTGATIGKIGLVPEVENLYTNQRVGKVFPNEELVNPTPFIFCFYSQKSILEQIVALSSSSSAQPNISGGQLESFEIVANCKTINMFNEIMQPCFDKINDLHKQKYLLEQSRDRLLPKLMNGEIEV